MLKGIPKILSPFPGSPELSHQTIAASERRGCPPAEGHQVTASIQHRIPPIGQRGATLQ